MTDILRAPGLKSMRRRNGATDVYWVADEKLVRKGYRPKTVRLFGEWPSVTIAARCQVLQAEMLEWAAGIEPIKRPEPAGTLGRLCRDFESDEESPFRTMRQATQVFYARYIRVLRATAGDSYVSHITGRDVRGWHRDWLAEMGERSAYGCVQTLRRVVSYGCELRDRDALELSMVLKRTEFTVPKGRRKRPTYEQIVAFRKAAREAGRASLALAVTLQFELGLRQKDVIGEWSNRGEGMEGWAWGLTWAHIDADMLLRKPTSKSNGTEVAEHDLRLHPDVMAELPERSVGPIVVDERTGRPWSTSHFSRSFRKVARLAGWPDDVWNMDSRAGAVSEAFEAGAEPADVMKAATHRQLSTTMGYNRGAIVQSNRVAKLRQRSRNKDGTEPR